MLNFRRHNLALMQDKSSAERGLLRFTQQADDHVTKFDAVCNPVVTSIALLSLAHLSSCAKALGAKLPPELKHFTHKLVDLTIARRQDATNHVVTSVCWALARLHIRPASMVPAYESALADMFIQTQQEANMQGASIMLYAISTLNINPLQGKLLQSIEDVLVRELSKPDLDCKFYMQSFSVAMYSYAKMRMHIKPDLAWAIATHFHSGLQKGADEPQGIANMAWAWAVLGYAVPPDMLDACRHGIQQSSRPFRNQHHCLTMWALAVYGRLDLAFLQDTVRELRGRPVQVNAVIALLHSVCCRHPCLSSSFLCPSALLCLPCPPNAAQLPLGCVTGKHLTVHADHMSCMMWSGSELQAYMKSGLLKAAQAAVSTSCKLCRVF